MSWWPHIAPYVPLVGVATAVGVAAWQIARAVQGGYRTLAKEDKELRQYLVEKNEAMMERIHTLERDRDSLRANFAGHEKLTESLVNELRRQIERTAGHGRDLSA